MDKDVLEEIAKQQFILKVRNSITRERLIVKRPEKLKDAIEFARLSEVAGKTARGNPPPSNKYVFVAMPFQNSDYSRTRNNLESPGSRNSSSNNFIVRKILMEILKITMLALAMVVDNHKRPHNHELVLSAEN